MNNGELLWLDKKKEIISCLIIPNLVTKCVDYRLLLKEEYKEYC